MKREMTIPAFGKRLAALEGKELGILLCSMYKNCEQAEQMLNLSLLGENYGRKLLEQYQDEPDKLFFPYNLMSGKGFSLSNAKKVLTDL